MLVRNVTEVLADWAPLDYQEPYDNSGLLVGDEASQLTGVLVALDVTEAVLEEALSLSCNLVVSHHPLLFKPIRRLTPHTTTGKLLLRAARHDLAIYAIHTNLDNVSWGVNAALAELLGLQHGKPLLPKPHMLGQLVVFVPKDATETLLKALHRAGAGHIGDYSQCSFVAEGTGRFMPSASANPRVGQRHTLSEVREDRVELIFPWQKRQAILEAMQQHHPYEEVAYYLYRPENTYAGVGSGWVGELPAACSAPDFLALLKETFQLPVLRHTAYASSIRRVALCGGAGAFLMPHVRRAQADAYLTADVKYHEFFVEENCFMLCDIGHYESERHVERMISAYLEQHVPRAKVHVARTVTNPVQYYF